MASPRKRGRPALDQRTALTSAVCVRFPPLVHDELLRLARLRDTTLPDFVRDCVFSELRKNKTEHSALP